MTIKETMKYTGLSHVTLLKRIKDGELSAERDDSPYNPAWLIPADEVERLRLEQVAKFTRKLDQVSTPVPSSYVEQTA